MLFNGVPTNIARTDYGFLSGPVPIRSHRIQYFTRWIRYRLLTTIVDMIAVAFICIRKATTSHKITCDNVKLKDIICV